MMEPFDLPEPPEDILWFLGSICLLTAAVMTAVGMQGSAPEVLFIVGLCFFGVLAGLNGIGVTVNALAMTTFAILFASMFSLGVFTRGLPPFEQWVPIISSFGLLVLYTLGLLVDTIIEYKRDQRTRTTAGQ